MGFEQGKARGGTRKPTVRKCMVLRIWHPCTGQVDPPIIDENDIDSVENFREGLEDETDNNEGLSVNDRGKTSS